MHHVKYVCSSFLHIFAGTIIWLTIEYGNKTQLPLIFWCKGGVGCVRMKDEAIVHYHSPDALRMSPSKSCLEISQLFLFSLGSFRFYLVLREKWCKLM